MKELKVRLTFTEDVLGTANADKNVHSEFIASKAPDAPSREEEVQALGAEEVERKEMTVFPRTYRARELGSGASRKLDRVQGRLSVGCLREGRPRVAQLRSV